MGLENNKSLTKLYLGNIFIITISRPLQHHWSWRKTNWRFSREKRQFA